MTSRFTNPDASAFFTAMIVVTLASWPISFRFGAYGEVVYSDQMTIWMASLAALFAGAVILRTQEGEPYLTWWGAVLLLGPTLAVTSIYWEQALPWLAQLVGWLSLLALPYILYIVVQATGHVVMEITDRRLMIWLLIGVLALNLLALGLGRFNYLVMTCEDFTVAGDDRPANCWPADRP